MHQMHSQAGLFAIHTKLLTVIVMQHPGSCNMTTSLVADDPKAYMVKMCSPGYYGRCAPCVCCTMLRLERLAMAGQALSAVRNAGARQPSPAIICAVLHHVVFAGLGWACLRCAVPIRVFSSALPHWRIWTGCCVVLLMSTSC